MLSVDTEQIRLDLDQESCVRAPRPTRWVDEEPSGYCARPLHRGYRLDLTHDPPTVIDEADLSEDRKVVQIVETEAAVFALRAPNQNAWEFEGPPPFHDVAIVTPLSATTLEVRAGIELQFEPDDALAVGHLFVVSGDGGSSTPRPPLRRPTAFRGLDPLAAWPRPSAPKIRRLCARRVRVRESPE